MAYKLVRESMKLNEQLCSQKLTHQPEGRQ